jgi:hypothetical protein
MDNVFSIVKIDKKDDNLIVFICVLLAAKLNTKMTKQMLFSHVVEFFEYKYSKEYLIDAENVIFSKILKFRLNLSTSFSFLVEFFEIGVYSMIGKLYNNSNILEKEKTYKTICLKVLKIIIKIYDNYQFLPSMVASISLVLTNKLLELELWNEKLQKLTKTKFNKIESFVEYVFKHVQKKLSSYECLIKNFKSLNLFADCQNKSAIVSKKNSCENSHLDLDLNIKELNDNKNMISVEKLEKLNSLQTLETLM